MNNIDRRQILQGMAASVLATVATALPSQADAALDAAIDASKQWVNQIWRYEIRYVVEPVFKSSFAFGDRVQIRLKNKRGSDKRSFKAASLETAEGRVDCVIPSGAVPWRYVHAKTRLPMRFIRKAQRLPHWQRPATGPLYLVGSKSGYALLPHWRMRSTKPATLRLNETHSRPQEKTP